MISTHTLALLLQVQNCNKGIQALLFFNWPRKKYTEIVPYAFAQERKLTFFWETVNKTIVSLLIVRFKKGLNSQRRGLSGKEGWMGECCTQGYMTHHHQHHHLIH